jgi:DNA repair protein RecO (recombination protein O)
MGFTRTEAIVLKTKNLREADKLITLFTREHGKMQAVAKGLRKVKTRYGASLEMFTHNQVMLFNKTDRDLAKVTGCQVLHPFYSLRESFFKYSMASYLLELVDQLSEYNQANEDIFNLLGKCFSLMETGELKTRDNYLLLWDWFAVQVLDMSGYRLALQDCVFCHSQAGHPDEAVYLSLLNGGLVCPDCLSRSGEVDKMMGPDFRSLIRLQNCDLSGITGLDIIPDSRVAIKKYLEKYFNYLLGYPLNCQDFFMTGKAAA